MTTSTAPELRRSRRSSAVPLIWLLAAMLVCSGPHAAASPEATPAATPDQTDGIGLPEGVTLQILAYGIPPADSGTPVDVTLFRLSFEPGSVYPLGGNDPATSLAYVERGVFSMRLRMDVTVQRATGDDDLFTELFEPVPAGTETSLETGDSVLLAAGMSGELRNGGSEPASLLVAQILEPDAGVP